MSIQNYSRELKGEAQFFFLPITLTIKLHAPTNSTQKLKLMGRGVQFTYIPTLPLTWRLPQFTYIPTVSMH